MDQLHVSVEALATLDASWWIRDADSAIHPAGYFARSAQPL